jgi:hypothetical protein
MLNISSTLINQPLHFLLATVMEVIPSSSLADLFAGKFSILLVPRPRMLAHIQFPFNPDSGPK